MTLSPIHVSAVLPARSASTASWLNWLEGLMVKMGGGFDGQIGWSNWVKGESVPGLGIEVVG